MDMNKEMNDADKVLSDKLLTRALGMMSEGGLAALVVKTAKVAARKEKVYDKYETDTEAALAYLQDHVRAGEEVIGLMNEIEAVLDAAESCCATCNGCDVDVAHNNFLEDEIDVNFPSDVIINECRKWAQEHMTADMDEDDEFLLGVSFLQEIVECGSEVVKRWDK